MKICIQAVIKDEIWQLLKEGLPFSAGRKVKTYEKSKNILLLTTKVMTEKILGELPLNTRNGITITLSVETIED